MESCSFLSDQQRDEHNVKKEKNNADKCEYCKKEFSSKEICQNYIKKFYEVKKPEVAIQSKIKCQEGNCGKTFLQVAPLRSHLNEVHHFKNHNNESKLKFEHFHDFCEWLVKEENTYNVKYVLNAVNDNMKWKGHVSRMFCCHRSRHNKPKVLELLEAQETQELGFHCTSSITVKEYPDHCTVSYFKEHYKHETALCHSPLDAENEIADASMMVPKKKRASGKRPRKHKFSGNQFVNKDKTWGQVQKENASMMVPKKKRASGKRHPNPNKFRGNKYLNKDKTRRQIQKEIKRIDKGDSLVNEEQKTLPNIEHQDFDCNISTIEAIAPQNEGIAPKTKEERYNRILPLATKLVRLAFETPGEIGYSRRQFLNNLVAEWTNGIETNTKEQPIISTE